MPKKRRAKDRFKRHRDPPDPGSPLLERMKRVWQHRRLKDLPKDVQDCYLGYSPSIFNLPGETNQREGFHLSWVYRLPCGLRTVHLRCLATDVCSDEFWISIVPIVAYRIADDLLNPRARPCEEVIRRRKHAWLTPRQNGSAKPGEFSERALKRRGTETNYPGGEAGVS